LDCRFGFSKWPSPPVAPHLLLDVSCALGRTSSSWLRTASCVCPSLHGPFDLKEVFLQFRPAHPFFFALGQAPPLRASMTPPPQLPPWVANRPLLLRSGSMCLWSLSLHPPCRLSCPEPSPQPTAFLLLRNKFFYVGSRDYPFSGVVQSAQGAEGSCRNFSLLVRCPKGRVTPCC